MPFLAYAARYWGWHARSIERPLIPLIRKLLEDFNLRASSYQVLHSRQSQSPQLSEAIFAALPTGEGPLHVTAHWNLPETTAIYLEHSDPSCVDAQGWTPLHWACSKGSTLVREMLLERGAALDIRDSHGWTPLFWASFSGDVEAVKSLLSRGADHLAKDIHSWSALQWAASRGERRATVAQLVKHGADYLAKDEAGWQPLHLAIHSGCEPAVDVLIDAGADIRATTAKWPSGGTKPTGLYAGDAWGGFPLHLAAMSGSFSVVEKLLAKGADARANLSVQKDYCWQGHGPTPLHIALDTDTFYGRKGSALDAGRLKIAAMLVEHGADVKGVANRITLNDVPKFEGFEELWDSLRAGVTEDGEKI
ncbi:ankyrin [Cylindrobasidium torrendii FP15055 ss-10]|uniref:Ankyrin n=1 Tax=Cylindrobasidium torrendii FP15055 ss-10 TaxID=1314674 RepID=A0A0D7BTA7_9AGAR|nr:ankyrin [Cylindrobasidium torrendii FP15055 ss-10]